MLSGGNGFHEGHVYIFKLRAEGNVARVVLDNGAIRYEPYPFQAPSMHLGITGLLGNAGYFEEVTE